MYDRHLSAEFRSEIQTLSKVEHLNLVKFLGYLVDAGAAEVPGWRRGGGDGHPDTEEQRGGGGGREGDGAGGRVRGSGSRGAADHAAVRRGALVCQARLPARAAACRRRCGGRGRGGEAARWLHEIGRAHV